MTEFAKALKAWREQNGISAKKLSARIGKSPAYVSVLESQKWNPHPKTIARFRAAGFNYSGRAEGVPEAMASDAVVVGQALVRARVARGWSQRDVAKKIGTTQFLVSLAERGVWKHQATRVAAAAIQKLLGVTTSKSAAPAPAPAEAVAKDQVPVAFAPVVTKSEFGSTLMTRDQLIRATEICQTISASLVGTLNDGSRIFSVDWT